MLRRSDTAAARSIENGWIYLRKMWKILLLTLLDAELIHCHCNRAFSQGLCAFERVPSDRPGDVSSPIDQNLLIYRSGEVLDLLENETGKPKRRRLAPAARGGIPVPTRIPASGGPARSLMSCGACCRVCRVLGYPAVLGLDRGSNCSTRVPERIVSNETPKFVRTRMRPGVVLDKSAKLQAASR